MNEQHRTVPHAGVPNWYTAAIPGMLVALTVIMVLARTTA